MVRLEAVKKELAFCLNEIIYTRNNRICLSEICSIDGADDKNLANAFFDVNKKVITLTAFEISKKLGELYPDFSITNMGPTICNVFLNNREQKKILLFLKVVFLSLVMFFGGAIAIMTFHEDVDMRDVHSGIYNFFTGEELEYVPIVSIPYSIGIAIGFIMLFGLFKRKNSNPTVLDLDIQKHENAFRKYMSEKNKSDDE